MLSAAATVPRLNWLVFVEQPVSQSFRPVIALLGRLAWLSALGLLLCVGAGMLLARRMIVPIRAVQEGASRVAAGDFSHNIDVHTGDEVEALADEFNRMAAQLREFYARLEQKVDDRTHDLARSVRELISLEEIGRALAASLELGEVLQTALTRAVELAEADGGAIYNFDRERGAFHLAEAHGLDPSFVAALREVKLTRLDGLLGEVAEHGRTVQVPEISEVRGVSAARGDDRRRLPLGARRSAHRAGGRARRPSRREPQARPFPGQQGEPDAGFRASVGSRHAQCPAVPQGRGEQPPARHRERAQIALLRQYEP